MYSPYYCLGTIVKCIPVEFRYSIRLLPSQAVVYHRMLRFNPVYFKLLLFLLDISSGFQNTLLWYVSVVFV
jgi:hypothetical protein